MATNTTKKKLNSQTQKTRDLERALKDILSCSRLDTAKEIAARELGVDLDYYIEFDEYGDDDFQELDFE